MTYVQDFWEFLNKPTDWIIVGFMCFFSLGLALFYTLLKAVLFEKILKKEDKTPGWLFFGLFPIIILLSKIIFDFNSLAVIIFLIGLLVFFMIVGIVLYIATDLIKEIIKKIKKGKRRDILWGILKVSAILVVIYFYGLTSAVILLIIVVILLDIFKPHKKDAFLNLQATLPTSKLSSMAMGIVEVKGKTIMHEPLLSRIGKKECIGYRYKIESISKDSDGNKTYSTVSDEVFCNDFSLKDDTTTVQVKADDIQFLWLKKDDSYSSGYRRYTQYLLFENEDIILIGKANSKANKVFIEKETIKNIFTLAPYNTVTRWNRYKPLLGSFKTFISIVFLLIAFILISEVTIEHIPIVFKKYFYLDDIINQPEKIALFAGLGMPVVIFVCSLFARVYRPFKFAVYLNIIIFSCLFFTWLSGFTTTMLFLALKITAVKIYFSWIVLLLSSLIFSIINNKTLAKLYKESIEIIKAKQKRKRS